MIVFYLIGMPVLWLGLTNCIMEKSVWRRIEGAIECALSIAIMLIPFAYLVFVQA